MDVLDPQWSEHNVFRSLNSGHSICQTVKNLQDRSIGDPDRRALFVIAEFADVLAKSTTQGGSTILIVLRDCWDNGALDNTSVSKPSRVRGATVSMIGMTTVEDLNERLDLRELATGTMNRVLMIKVERSKVLPGAPPVLEKAMVAPIVARLRANVERVRATSIIKATSVSKPLRLSKEGEGRVREPRQELGRCRKLALIRPGAPRRAHLRRRRRQPRDPGEPPRCREGFRRLRDIRFTHRSQRASLRIELRSVSSNICVRIRGRP